jgi:hypothetical protein
MSKLKNLYNDYLSKLIAIILILNIATLGVSLHTLLNLSTSSENTQTYTIQQTTGGVDYPTTSVRGLEMRPGITFCDLETDGAGNIIYDYISAEPLFLETGPPLFANLNDSGERLYETNTEFETAVGEHRSTYNQITFSLQKLLDGLEITPDLYKAEMF